MSSDADLLPPSASAAILSTDADLLPPSAPATALSICCRLQHLLTLSAPLQMKQKLLSGMVGGAYTAMALTGSGSFLLERCFDMAVRVGRQAGKQADKIPFKHL